MPADVFRVADSQVASRWGNILRLPGLRPDHAQRARGALRARRPGLRGAAAGAEALRARQLPQPDPQARRARRSSPTASARPSRTCARSSRSTPSPSTWSIRSAPATPAFVCHARAYLHRQRGGRGHARLHGGRHRPASRTATCRSAATTCWTRSPRSSAAPPTRPDPGPGGGGRPRVRVIVVGLGVQGAKRKTVAGADFVAAVDPVNADAEFRNLQDVPRRALRRGALLHPRRPQDRAAHAIWPGTASTCWWRSRCGPPTTPRSAGSRRWRGRPARCSTPPTTTASSRTTSRMRDLIASGRLGAALSLPHVLRQRHGPAGARVGLARPRLGRAARPGLAPPRHRAVLVRRARRGLPRRVLLQPSRTAPPTTSSSPPTPAGRSSSWR